MRLRRTWYASLLGLALWAGPAHAADPPPEAEAHQRALAPSEADTRRFDRARLAMTFGDYDVARQLLVPLATTRPDSPEVQTNVGLAWMGTYFEHYGLSEPTFARLQGLLVDPAHAVAAGETLPPDQLERALARGFAVAGELPTGGTRGGSTAPEPIVRAEAALVRAHALSPGPRSLVNVFLAEVELARFDKKALPLVAAHRAEIEGAIGKWSADDAGLGWVALGVERYGAKDGPGAVADFAKADALGNPLGRYDLGLVLAFDPAFADRRSEGVAALASFGADPEMASGRVAERAGLLPTRTAWPLGNGEVLLSSTSSDVAGLVAVIQSPDVLPEGASGTALGDYRDIAFANGMQALVEPDVAAWIILPRLPTTPAPNLATTLEPARVFESTTTETVAVTESRKSPRLHPEHPPEQQETEGWSGASLGPAVEVEPLVTPVLDAPASHVRLRVQEACLGEDTSEADSRVTGAARDCPTVMEVRLAE